jgi:hypothetical protein
MFSAAVLHYNLSTTCSAAKAAISLARYCPFLSMAPVIGDCEDGGGIVLNKDQGPDPDGEIV